MRPISTSFAPNFENDDTVLAVKLIVGTLFGKNYSQQKEGLRKSLSTYFDNSEVFLFSSARAGIMYALGSLDLQENDEVILQAFTCVAVPAAIRWAGLKPVFADVEAQTYNLDIADVRKKITPRTKAIIIQHTFGIPGPIEGLKALAHEKNLYIIEDCAHVFGALYDGKNNDKKIGTFGDVAVFSFGRDKALSSVFGGTVITHKKLLAQKLEKYESGLQKAPMFFSLQQLTYLLVYAAALPTYTAFLGKIILKLARQVGLLSQAVYPQEYKGEKPDFLQYSFHPALCALAYHQFLKIERFNTHRREIVNLYIDLLGLPLKKGSVLVRVPLTIEHKQSFLAAAKKRGFYLDSWYRSAIDPPQSNLSIFNYSPCPVAEKLSQTVVNLPTHINISPSHAHKIINLCKALK